jgi:hypothetical protein
MISFVSSITIERHATWMHGLPARVIIYGFKADYLDTKGSSNPFASVILRLFVCAFLLPISFIEIVAGRWMKLSRNYIRPADKMIRQAFLLSMARLLAAIGMQVGDLADGQPWEYEIERLAVHCALERAPSHVYSLRNYVVLFGFLRAMCLILVGTFWAVLVHSLVRHEFLQVAATFAIGSLIIFTCYASFMKFWFRYYYEAIMAIIATAPASSESLPQAKTTAEKT